MIMEEYCKLLRKERIEEQHYFLKKANNNPAKALKLWIGEIKNRRKRAQLPLWWKSVTNPL